MLEVRRETEKPFENEYWDHFEKGVYVDKETKKPLFRSEDKFECEAGYPCFSDIVEENITEIYDYSFGMLKIEVRAKESNAMLGYLFKDGPAEKGGKRYTIFSGPLEFIPEK